MQLSEFLDKFVPMLKYLKNEHVFQIVKEFERKEQISLKEELKKLRDIIDIAESFIDPPFHNAQLGSKVKELDCRKNAPHAAILGTFINPEVKNGIKLATLGECTQELPWSKSEFETNQLVNFLKKLQ